MGNWLSEKRLLLCLGVGAACICGAATAEGSAKSGAGAPPKTGIAKALPPASPKAPAPQGMTKDEFLSGREPQPRRVEEAMRETSPQRMSVSDEIKQRQDATLSEFHRQSMMKRQAAAQRREARNFHQFRSKDGVITFTNIPEKYEANKNFERVNLQYTPISVPKKYKTFTTVKMYTPSNIAELVKQYATQYGVDEGLVCAVIKCESNFNPNAVSPAGACGLMQLMPGTAEEMGVTRIFDPAENIAGGTQYLAKVLALFNGDVKLALAGYNAGPEAVRRYGGIPPYQETQNYVVKVINAWKGFSKGGIPTETGRFTYLANAPAPKAPVMRAFTVTFHSGLVQAADQVVDNDPYYDIKVADRTYSIRKALVKTVSGTAKS